MAIAHDNYHPVYNKKKSAKSNSSINGSSGKTAPPPASKFRGGSISSANYVARK